MNKLRLAIIFILVAAFSFEHVCAYAWPSWPLFPPQEPKTKDVPIIMYHLITKQSNQLGKFAITPDEMEADLKYLVENGYETVCMADLIRFVDGRKTLPDKPVVLTFDDGRNSDYDYLLPLLKEYDMKAVLSIVGEFTDEYTKVKFANKPHLTWDQIEEMHKSKRVEFQNHSYHFHDGIGCGRRKSESMEAYQDRLKADLSKLQETLKKKIGRAPTTFTYPLGVISKGSQDVLKDLNMKASLSCWEGMNTITEDDPDCLFLLKRNIRRYKQPISSILNNMEKQSNS
jgi:peptidoglycan/xylan/chitin deacetylase (PgdA/CDA1 family)